MSAATHPLIAAALAQPLTHSVVVTYDDYTVRTHECRSEAAAILAAAAERRKIGRALISRNADLTAGPVRRVANVSVGTIEQGELAAEYVDLVGYDPFADDPTLTVADVRELLGDIRAQHDLK